MGTFPNTLASRTEKSAPAADPEAPNTPPADGTRRTFSSVDLVEALKTSLLAHGIPVIPDGRALAGDGSSQNIFYGFMHPLELSLSQSRSRDQGVKPCLKKNLIGIDVADTSQKSLVKEQALQPGLPSLKTPLEGGQSNLKGLRSKRFELVNGGRFSGLETGNETEFADISESKLSFPAFKRNDEMRMLIHGFIRRGKEEHARHLQMNKKDHILFTVDNDHLSPAPDAADLLSPEFSYQTRTSIPKDRRIEDFKSPNPESPQLRGKASDNGLDFR